MTLDKDSKCTFLSKRFQFPDILCRDPVVVMVLSLGFIASVFMLQYCPNFLEGLIDTVYLQN